ncbi:hypothetical protein H632_c3113p0 [Helicosporidium sp. ATCC 50920]|nr:hypothetical protein H632_c3113p0 [Helicosporidium sp. ATCC 50920]|eukprot:KDD72623.1 hypothetical protein H632_c3113p0 [Helicosporidium sp. ATCC 50920]
MHREYTHALLAMCMSFDEGILFETGDFECCAFVHLSKDDGSKQMTEAEYKEMEEDLSVCELQNMIKPEYHAHLGDFDALLPVARRLCVKEHGPVNNIFLMGSHTRNQGLGTRLVRGIKGYSARQGRGTFAEVSNKRACHLFERNGFSSKPDVRVIDSQLLFKPMAAV